MDEKDKEIEALQKKLKEAEEAKANIEKEKEDVEKKLTDAEKAITEKDLVIEDKNNDIVGLRRGMQKLKELTEEDKANMTEREINLHNAALDLQKQQQDFQKQQEEVQQREVEGRKSSAIKKLVGDNPELIKKIEANYGRIKDSENAVTDEEVGNLVNEAFNMLGEEKPDPVRQAVNADGGEAPGESGGQGFGDSEDGKKLADAMGLPQVEEQGAPAGGENK